MRVLVISDLHYERKVFHGVDESRAWEWFMGIVDYHGPDAVLSCGDWGTAVNEAGFYDLLRRAVVLTIYGNHENMGVLTRLYNVRAKAHLPVLMEDGRVYEVGGLRVAGISGIISERRRVRKGVPRKTPEEFLEVAKRLAGKGVDILLMHETPYFPDLFPFMRKTVASTTALEALRTVRPRLAINGHIHPGGYRIKELPWGTLYINVDSSQQSRHYLILRKENGVCLEVWHDYERITDTCEEHLT